MLSFASFYKGILLYCIANGKTLPMELPRNSFSAPHTAPYETDGKPGIDSLRPKLAVFARLASVLATAIIASFDLVVSRDYNHAAKIEIPELMRHQEAVKPCAARGCA